MRPTRWQRFRDWTSRFVFSGPVASVVVTLLFVAAVVGVYVLLQLLVYGHVR